MANMIYIYCLSSEKDYERISVIYAYFNWLFEVCTYNENKLLIRIMKYL